MKKGLQRLDNGVTIHLIRVLDQKNHSINICTISGVEKTHFSGGIILKTRNVAIGLSVLILRKLRRLSRPCFSLTDLKSHSEAIDGE